MVVNSVCYFSLLSYVLTDVSFVWGFLNVARIGKRELE